METQYNIARTTTLSASALSILWVLFGDKISLENFYIAEVSRLVGSTTYALTIILLAVSLWCLLEWFKVDTSRRKLVPNIIDVGFVSTTSIVAITLVQWKTFPYLAVWHLPIWVVVLSILLGLISGNILSSITLSLSMIRSKEEAKRLMLPRVPVPTQAMASIGTIFIFVLTLALYLIAKTNLENDELKISAFGIYLTSATIIWAITHFSDLLQSKERKSSFQEVFDWYDAITLNGEKTRFFFGESVDDLLQKNEIEPDFMKHDPTKSKFFKQVTKPIDDETLEKFIVKYENGGDPNESSNDGWTEFMIATVNNDIRAFEVMLKYGGDVRKTNAFGRTSLHYICRYGYIDLASRLISEGADVNAASVIGSTPLMIACEFNQLECVRLLLKNDANPFLETVSGETALSFAEKRKHGKCAALIRKAIQKLEREKGG